MAKFVPALQKLIRSSKTPHRIVQSNYFCTNNNSTGREIMNPKHKNGTDNNVVVHESYKQLEAYKNLENLDFMTSVKMLFTAPVNKKKFGLDFHLVQFFFCCMPSLAVYLVAKYARYQMRIMEAELAVKKKAEDEKAKVIESKLKEEKELESESKLSDVKARLDKLEETIKEIAVQSKQKLITSTSENGGKVAVNQQDNAPVPAGEGNLQTKTHLSDFTPQVVGSKDKGHSEDSKR